MKTIRHEKSIKIILIFIAFGLFLNFINFYINPANAAADLWITIVGEHKHTKEHITFHHWQTVETLKEYISKACM